MILEHSFLKNEVPLPKIFLNFAPYSLKLFEVPTGFAPPHPMSYQQDCVFCEDPATLKYDFGAGLVGL